MSTGLTLPHAFHATSSSTSLKDEGAMSTGSQDAGGSFPDLSSHKEACLEASFPLAALLWP